MGSGLLLLAKLLKDVCVSVYAAGDVEIGLLERNGGLEVEVVQARGLTMKPGSKTPPGPFRPKLRRRFSVLCTEDAAFLLY